ncbi:MAG: FAD-binding oxidoreductase, partial [Microlunatus sp.]|nr:FAD-binding oxidoreductase [Microlunatus sp.]
MGWLPVLAQVATRVPGLVNLATGIRPLAALAKRIGGIAPERDLPVFATQSFTTWWHLRRASTTQPRPAPNGPVLLWPDTFTNMFHPGIAQAAVAVLEDAGFEVVVPEQPVCCGLTWVSTGQLGMARRVLRRTLRILHDDIRAGVPVVGLEPSCTAMLTADGPELLGGDEDMRRVAAIPGVGLL